MVKYWKYKDAVEAKVTQVDGVTVMIMDGEDYTFPGFPRGYLLYGKLSKLKHEIKNQLFNDSWAKLEDGVSKKQVAKEIKSILPGLLALSEESRYDRLPPEKMCAPVREIHRAWTKVSPETAKLRDMVCYVLQEDDAYRFRFQWIASYFPWFVDPVKAFDRGLEWLEIAEVIGDMKEKQVLFRRIIKAILRDKSFATKFRQLYKEINWKKVKMSKADKYFFRGKYFKVDLDKFEY